MSKYQENERKKAIERIENGNLFEDCKAGGKFRGKERDFVLLNGNFNLFKSIREEVKNYFEENDISWWSGRKPTGHVLSSQIACINHLFPLRNDKNEVLKIAKIICEDIIDVLEIEANDIQPAYISFEAVGGKDYLNECKGEKPTRGSNCTSIDALIYAKHKNGKNYILPIEWKYTEHYKKNEDKSLEPRKGEPEGTNGKGEERLNRYVNGTPYLIPNSEQLAKFNDYRSSVYFFEPFYQLMRQTLWAEQMIAHKDDKDNETIKAEDFIHTHIIPQENGDLLNYIYPCSRKDMETTWRECLQDQSKYKIISPKDLLSNIDPNKYADLKNYLMERYW